MRRLKRLLLFLVAVPVVNTVSGIVLNNLFLNPQLSEGEINAFTVSRIVEEKVTSIDFRGGYPRAVMGKVELDLTEATIEDPPVTIKTTIVMGTAAITVPEGWKVKVDVSGVYYVPVRGAFDEGESPDLVLTGKVMMGRLTINHNKADKIAEVV